MSDVKLLERSREYVREQLHHATRAGLAEPETPVWEGWALKQAWLDGYRAANADTARGLSAMIKRGD